MRACRRVGGACGPAAVCRRSHQRKSWHRVGRIQKRPEGGPSCRAAALRATCAEPSSGGEVAAGCLEARLHADLGWHPSTTLCPLHGDRASLEERCPTSVCAPACCIVHPHDACTNICFVATRHTYGHGDPAHFHVSTASSTPHGAKSSLAIDSARRGSKRHETVNVVRAVGPGPMGPELEYIGLLRARHS